VKWYRKAAEQGNAQAQVKLGLYYFKSEGVATNFHEGVKWYRQAAKKADASAQVCLGICYAQGVGVVKDSDEAVKRFRRGAVQGNRPMYLRDWSLVGTCESEASRAGGEICTDVRRDFLSGLVTSN